MYYLGYFKHKINKIPMKAPQTGLHFVLPVSFEIKYREPEKTTTTFLSSSG